MEARSGHAIAITQEMQKLALLSISAPMPIRQLANGRRTKRGKLLSFGGSGGAGPACLLPRTALGARLCIQLARKVLKMVRNASEPSSL
jgi:hypothetical protein